MSVPSDTSAPTPPEPDEEAEGRAVTPGTSLAGPSSIPAPPVGGPRPTINASPTSGYAGEAITLSGQGVAGHPSVRLAWVLEGATQTLDVVSVDGSNAYSTTVEVPTEAVTGTNEICAAVTGTTQAEFACTSFTVETPPPSTLEGSIFGPEGVPGGGTLSGVTVNLFDELGNLVGSTEANPDGSFSLSGLPPGEFTLGAAGNLPALVGNDFVSIPPGSHVGGIDLPEVTCSDAKVTRLRGGPTAVPADNSADWGTYISLGSGGDAVNVTFQADVQYSVAVDHVEFEIERPDGSTVDIGSDDRRPYRAQYNVSLLPPGVATLRATPVPVGGGEGDPCRSATKTIKVVDNPLESNFLVGNQISWIGGQQHYNFDGQIPSLGGLLPLVWPDPPPTLPKPLNNELRNEFNAGLLFEANVDLSGRVSFRMMEAELYGEVFSQTVFDEGFGLKSSGVNAVHVDPHNVRALSVDYGPHKIAEYHNQQTLFSSVLFSAVIVDVRATVKLGLNGSLYLEGTVQPLMPAFDSTLTANANPKLIGTLAVDAKVARLEGRLIPSILLSVPLVVRTTVKPYVHPETPCFIFRFDVNARVKVINPNPFKGGWKTIWSKTKNVVDEHQPPGCSAPGTARILATAPPPSRVLPSPDVASGPFGEIAAVYVKDATPNQDTSTTAVAIRFRSSSSDTFGPETVLAVGDGSRDVYNVSDPVVTFVGDTGETLVAWTETVITEGEADGMSGAPEEIMAHQEIAYAAPDDGPGWLEPQRLTDDTVPDGMADIDGDVGGATLAWVHDTGGVLSDTSRIRVSHWEVPTSTWSTPAELNAYFGNTEAMNHQVSVDRKDYPGGETYKALAWTADEDGDLTTPDDRYVALSTEGELFGNPLWFTDVLTEGVGLPAGVDSPSVALLDPQNNGYDRIDLAFLRRGGVEFEGQTRDLGMVSNQAQVWLASKYPFEGWLVDPVVDELGNPVLGEAPQLTPTGLDAQDTLLAFRRFGEAETIGLTGQMAVSKNGLPPLPYTNDLNQHWLPSFALDVTTGDAMLVNVSQSFGLSAAKRASLEQELAAASGTARPAAETNGFSVADGSVVETIRIEPGADPALDPTLSLSQRHAPAGASVTVTGTVRNLGRDLTGNLTFELYDGTPITGTRVFRESVGFLTFNDSVPISTTVTAAGGAQRLTARLVVDSGADVDTGNNEATADLGALPAPRTLDVQPSAQDDDALMLSWVAPPVPGVAGYRVFRSTSPGGPYDLVAETTSPFWTDPGRERGTTYYYAVQAYDAAGVRSPLSLEVAGLLPLRRAYVPLVLRGWE